MRLSPRLVALAVGLVLTATPVEAAPPASTTVEIRSLDLSFSAVQRIPGCRGSSLLCLRWGPTSSKITRIEVALPRRFYKDMKLSGTFIDVTLDRIVETEEGLEAVVVNRFRLGLVDMPLLTRNGPDRRLLNEGGVDEILGADTPPNTQRPRGRIRACVSLVEKKRKREQIRATGCTFPQTQLSLPTFP